jgi:hypothetical protein
MNQKQRIVLTLVFSFQATLALAAETATNCSATAGSPEAAKCSVIPPVVQAVTSPAASTVALPVATPVAPLTDVEKKSLHAEFKKALSNERSALQHQERSALRELRVAQSQKQRQWREEQKTARRKYFDEHKSGPERREYVQAYLKKKQDFENTQKVEYGEARKAWTSKIQAMKQSQKVAEEQFSKGLNQGQRPAADLWPKTH